MSVPVIVLSALTVAFATSNAVTKLEESQIAGGIEIDISYAPSQVAILFRNLQICSGTLIKNNVSLSAAHCLDDISELELKIRSGSNFHDKGGRVVAVARAKCHPKYRNEEHSVNFDIALFFLADSAMAPGLPAAIIVLWDTDSFFSPGTFGTLSGWGPTTEEGERSPVLRRVALPILSPDNCAAQIGRVLAVRNLCAGFPSGKKNGCEGDSGAGLVIGTKLAGVFAFGYDFSLKKPSVFASVPVFRRWIRRESGV